MAKILPLIENPDLLHRKDVQINPIFKKFYINPNPSISQDKIKVNSEILNQIKFRDMINPEIEIGNHKIRMSYKDNILGSRNSKQIETKIKDRKKLSTRPRNNSKPASYLPKHIEGKYSIEEVRYLKNKLKRNDTICAIVSCFGLFLAWTENEKYFLNNNKSDSINTLLRSIVTGTCFLSHYFIFNHYKLELEILKSRKIIYQGTSMLKSSLFQRYFFESVFNWIHCPPYLDFQFDYQVFGINFNLSLDAYLSVVMLGRFYIFFRLFDHYTFWTGERAIRVCRINGFLPDSKFAIKAYLKYKSVLVLTFSLGLSILLFGFALRTFERPFLIPNRSQQFNNIINAFWCIIVSMATIGYGDIYPITFMGRVVVIIACIWGIFILSLFVVSLNNIIQLSKEETLAYEEITRENKIKLVLHKDAAKIIVILLKLNFSRKRKINVNERILMRRDLMGIANRFKIKRKNLLNETKSIQEILEEIHYDVNIDIEDLMETIQPLTKITPFVKESEELQSIINEKTLHVHENSKRLMHIISKMNQDEIIAESFELVEPNFDKNNLILVENKLFNNGVFKSIN